MQEPVSKSLKYTSMGFQMIGTILVFGSIGWWIDKKWFPDHHFGLAIGLVFGVIGSIVKLIADALRDQKREENAKK
jgi:F0F1-type ATP synthase assembly protein I